MAKPMGTTPVRTTTGTYCIYSGWRLPHSPLGRYGPHTTNIGTYSNQHTGCMGADMQAYRHTLVHRHKEQTDEGKGSRSLLWSQGQLYETLMKLTLIQEEVYNRLHQLFIFGLPGHQGPAILCWIRTTQLSSISHLGPLNIRISAMLSKLSLMTVCSLKKEIKGGGES